MFQTPDMRKTCGLFDGKPVKFVGGNKGTNKEGGKEINNRNVRLSWSQREAYGY